MARPVPSALRIVQADYLALLCALGPAVTWVLVLAFEVLKLPVGRSGPVKEGDHLFLWLALAVTAVGVPALVTRVRGFARTFREGVEVEGRVVAVALDGDRGQVVYAFPHEGREQTVTRAIHRTARTSALAPGQPVVVVYDPRRPEGALLRDLFV